MKIGIVLSTIQVGGAEMVAYALMREMSKSYRIKVLSLLDMVDNKFMKRIGSIPNLDLKILGYNKSFLKLFPIPAVRKLEKFFTDVDVSISFTVYADYILSLSKLEPKVLSIHSTYMNRWKVPFVKKLDKYIYSRASKIVAVSKISKQIFLKNVKLNESLVKVIYNGVDVDKFYPFDIQRKRDSYTVLMVGRLIPVKNYEFAIKIFEILAKQNVKFNLSIVGNGILKHKLKQLANQFLPPGSFKFYEYIQNDYMVEMYRKSDIFLMTSYNEGIPVSLLEAMASGLPVVVSKVGGIPEVVSNNYNGYIIEQFDPYIFAEKINILLKNPEKRKLMGMNARKTILEKFSLKKMVVEYLSLLNSLVM